MYSILLSDPCIRGYKSDGSVIDHDGEPFLTRLASHISSGLQTLYLVYSTSSLCNPIPDSPESIPQKD